MSPTPELSPKPTAGRSVQLAAAGVVASYIHELSDRHSRRDEASDDSSPREGLE